MSISTSFTGSNSVRYPAPDIARGLMLILIAVANAPMWIAMFPERIDPGTGDQWWILIRGMFIDHRVYPLFAMLFGFGLMTMIIRRHDAHVDGRTADLDAKAPGMPPQIRSQWLAGFDKEATDAGRRLVRLRGYWMLLFGFIHGLFFFGDIIGTYALVAIIFAGLIARRRFVIMAVIGVIQIALMIISLYFQQIQVASVGASLTNQSFNYILHWYYPIISAPLWFVGTIFTALLAAVIPCTFIGAWLATTDIISRPDKHKGLLAALTVVGLGLGAGLGAPHSLYQAGFAATWPPGSFAVHEAAGVFGAIGWLALLALIGGTARGTLTGWRRVVSAVGKRSMTVYIGQTLLFIVIFSAMALFGARSVSALTGLVIGLVVWLLLAVFCFVLETQGYARGPLEVLLRRAVAKTTVNRPVPVIQFVPAVGVEGETSQPNAIDMTGSAQMPSSVVLAGGQSQTLSNPSDPHEPPNA